MEMKKAGDIESLRAEVIACLQSTQADANLGFGFVKDYLKNASDLKSTSEADIATFSQRVTELSSQLENLVIEVKNVAAEQAFLNSLSYPFMKDRFSQIMSNASKTLDWVFESASFMTWLERDSGIFWIAGKAGSGKSTLMGNTYVNMRGLCKQ